MRYLSSVIDAYRAHGYEIRTGLNPGHFANDRFVPYTILVKNGRIVPTGGGLALQEVFVLDLLARSVSPRNVFIIGNAFGWSTLVLSTMLPDSKLIAIDNCTEGGEARRGFELTNKLISELKLTSRIMVASSPDDVGPIVTRELGGIDLALIDGLHTNEQQLIDYQAVRPFMTERSLIVFHDVIDWGMEESFEHISRSWPGPSEILMRTPSGIGVCYTTNLEPEIGWIVSLFRESNLSGFTRNPIPSIIESYERRNRKGKTRMRRFLRRMRGKSH